MGTVYAEITLKNANDVGDFGRGYIREQDIHQTTVQAVVDTGANRLVIGEELCQKLGLRIVAEDRACLANNAQQACKLTEPVLVHWKDRQTVCSALVLPGAQETLLGVFPLEDLDLMVDPVHLQLTGVHGDKVVHMIR
jgi:clan AA aspartic protease